MLLKLVRLTEYKEATLGILIFNDQPLWKTLELPWRNNMPMVSCIPTGEYKVVKHLSPKFGRVLHVLDVPGRSEILIHAGNWTLETHGCILPGLTFGSLEGHPAVFESKKALGRILDAVQMVDDITLKIVSVID